VSTPGDPAWPAPNGPVSAYGWQSAIVSAGRYRNTAEFPMSSVINLRMARKRAKRRKAEQEAAANRLQHGASKEKRNLEQVRRDKAVMRLDQHRIDSGDEE
jgi:hypothetical protein